MEINKKALQLMELDSQLKDKNLFKMFSKEHLNMLKEYKSNLNSIVEMFEYQEDTTYHEIMMYANAVAMTQLPEYQLNIFITRTLLFKSTEQMAEQLNVCRPTLTNYIKKIKQQIKQNASNIIESYTN